MTGFPWPVLPGNQPGPCGRCQGSCRGVTQRLANIKHRTICNKLFRLQGGLCFYCGTRMGGCLNQDHVVSKSEGGQFKQNTVLAHYDCNTEKRDRAPTEDELERVKLLWAEIERQFEEVISVGRAKKKSEFIEAKKVARRSKRCQSILEASLAVPERSVTQPSSTI